MQSGVCLYLESHLSVYYSLERLEKKKKEGRTEKTVGRRKEYRVFWVVGYLSFSFSGIAGGHMDYFFRSHFLLKHALSLESSL